MTDTWRVVVALIGLGVIVEGVVLVAMMRQVGGLLLHGTPQTSVSSGPKLGTVLELPGQEATGRPTIVVFTSSVCDQCKALIPKLQGIRAEYGSGAAYGHQFDLVAVLTDRDLDAREKLARELGSIARTDLVALMQDWQIPGTPYAVALDAQFRVKAAAIVYSQMQLEMLAVERLGVLLVPPDGRFDDDPSLEITQVGSGSSHTAEVLR